MNYGRWIAWGGAAVLLSAAAVLLYAQWGAASREDVLWNVGLLVAGVLIGLAPRLPWRYERARRAADAELAAVRQGHDTQRAALHEARQRLAEERAAMQQAIRQAQEYQTQAQQRVADWQAKATDAERRRRNATGTAERRRRRLERLTERS